MKARNELGQIVQYSELPSNLLTNAGLITGFNYSDKETQEANGFFDLVTPEFDYYTQRLGAVYFDEANKIYTYPVETLEVPIPIPEVKLSMYDFLHRFTKPERKAIRINCKTDDDLEDDWDMATRMNQISRTNNKVTNLITTLVTKALLTPERALEVMQ